MKKAALMSCLAVLAATSLLLSPGGSQDLTGPYFGQKPPGVMPEIFAPGLVSKEGDQAKLNISPDLNEIIYWERKPPDNLNTIVRIVRDGEQWNAPEILPFSRDYITNEPSLSPDGNTLFFVSNRPRNKGGEPERTPDIWFVEKAEGKWGEPINLGSPINTDGVEVQPFMSVEPCHRRDRHAHSAGGPDASGGAARLSGIRPDRAAPPDPWNMVKAVA